MNPDSKWSQLNSSHVSKPILERLVSDGLVAGGRNTPDDLARKHQQSRAAEQDCASPKEPGEIRYITCRDAVGNIGKGPYNEVAEHVQADDTSHHGKRGQ